MNLRVLLLLLVSLVWGVAQASPDKPAILVVGDSLSAGYGLDPEQGWVALLEARLAENGHGYRVVNASISGDTTSGGRSRLPRALRVHEPAIVVIELGGNDGLRGLPVKTFRDNLRAMVDMSLEGGAAVLLVGIHIPRNYGPDYAEAFHGVYHELATGYELPLVPFLLDGVALDRSLMQDDGIHPNAAAQPRLLDNVWPHLQPLLD